MIKKIFIIMMTISLCLFGTFGTDTQIIEVEAGITPDSPLYFFDTLGEKISLAFTLNRQNKVNKALMYAQERNSEILETTDNDDLFKLNENFEYNLEKANSLSIINISRQIEEIKDENILRLSERLQNQIKTQNQVKENSQNKVIDGDNNEDCKKLSDIDKEYLVYSNEFNNNRFKINISDEDVIVKIQDNIVYQCSNSNNNNYEYEIKINDYEKALSLYQDYLDGNEVSYDDFISVVDMPLSLKYKIVKAIGMNGFNENGN